MIVSRNQFLDAICTDSRSEIPLVIFARSDGSCFISLSSYGISQSSIVLGNVRGGITYFKSLTALYKFFRWLDSVDGLEYSATYSCSNY